MKTYKTRMERQLQHSHDIMVHRINIREKARAKVAMLVGVGIVAAWLLLVAVCCLVSAFSNGG